MKPKELDCKITEILMCMYNSGDTTNCLADIKKLILEAEMKKGLEDFKICREEIEKARTELSEEIKKMVEEQLFWYRGEDYGSITAREALNQVKNLLNKKNETK